MDFGIARMKVSEVHTQTGAVMGSPKYMSPEQVTGQRPDHRSDLFSLGIILYELASGAAPFTSPTITGLMHAIATETPAPPSSVDASLPPVLDLIVARALEKERDARYQAAAEIAADLRACLERLAPARAGAPAAAPASETTLKATAIPDAALTVTLKGDSTLAPEATRAGVTPPPSRRPDSASGEQLATTGRMNPLYPARSFDSGAALQKLAVMASTGVTDAGAQPAAGFGNAVRAVWGDPDRRVLAIAVAAAIAGAVVIALL